MIRFWKPLIEPLLASLQPEVVVAIGSRDPPFIARLLDDCAERSATLHVVDAGPGFPEGDLSPAGGASKAEHLRVHTEPALEGLRTIGRFDLGLLAGEPNWFTVHGQLWAIHAAAGADALPVLLVGNTGWPYARRDRYSEPERIPEELRRPYRVAGLDPQRGEPLAEGGFAPGTAHAVREHCFQNGCLSAVEDFFRDLSGAVRLLTLPGFHGISVLAPPGRIDACAFLRRLFDDPGNVLLEAGYLQALEEARVRAELRESRRAGAAPADSTTGGQRLARPEAPAPSGANHPPTRGPGKGDAALEAKLEAARREVRRLASLLIRIRSEVLDLLESRRWRIGNAIGDLVQRLRRRPPTPTAADHLRELFRELGEAPLQALQDGSGPGAARDPQPHRPEAGRASLFHEHVSRIDGGDAGELFRAALDRSARETSPPEAPGEGSAPLVSIVMPTRNRAGIVDEAVRSVLEQSYSRWELIVCDDGGSDDTEERLRRLADSRITYFEISHAGAAAARNRCLERARGRYLAYLDSDNLWHPRFLETMVRRLEEEGTYDAAWSAYIDVTVDDGRYRLKGFEPPRFDYELLDERNFIDLNGFVHRRELYEVLDGFHETLPRQQDWDLVLRYTFHRDPLYVDALLTLYRRNRAWKQITYKEGGERPRARVREKAAGYYREGLPRRRELRRPSVAILASGGGRLELDRACRLAEALAADSSVHLVVLATRELGELPLRGKERSRLRVSRIELGAKEALAGLQAAADGIDEELLFGIGSHPRSLGVALLVNYRTGVPLVLDLEGPPGAFSPEEGLPLPRNGEGEETSWPELAAEAVDEIPYLTVPRVEALRTFPNALRRRCRLLPLVEDEELRRHYPRAAAREALGLASGERVVLAVEAGPTDLGSLAEAVDRVLLWKPAGSAEAPNDCVRTLVLDEGDRLLHAHAAADALFLAAKSETPELVRERLLLAIRSLALEVPVLAPPVPELRELADEGHVWTFDPARPEDPSRVLGEILGDPDRTSATLARARRFFLRRHSFARARLGLDLLAHGRALVRGRLPAAQRFGRGLAATAPEG